MIGIAARRVLIAIARFWLLATLGFWIARTFARLPADYLRFLAGLLNGRIGDTALCAACDPHTLIEAGFVLPTAQVLGAVLAYGALLVLLRLLLELRPGRIVIPACVERTLTFLILVALAIAPLAAPHLEELGVPPAWQRVLEAGRAAAPYALGATALGFPLAFAWGLAGGARALSASLDLLCGVPWVLLALLYVVLAKPTGWLLCVAVGLSVWLPAAIALRDRIVSANQHGYVLAARIAGVSRGAILRRHLLPNLAPELAAAAAGLLLKSLVLLVFLALAASKTVGKVL